MKYWVKTANRLLHRKEFFTDKSQVIDYLKKIKALSETYERQEKILSLKEKERHFSAQEFDKAISEIKKWEGYNYIELMDSIVVVRVEDDMIEARAFLRYT